MLVISVNSVNSVSNSVNSVNSAQKQPEKDAVGHVACMPGKAK